MHFAGVRMRWTHLAKPWVQCVLLGSAVLAFVAALASPPHSHARHASAHPEGHSFALPSILRQATSLDPTSAEPATVYLNNGTSGEFATEWRITLEATASDISEFDITYECEDASVLNGATDCRVELEKVVVRAVQDLYSGRVFCIARRFPGIAKCRLAATPKIDVESAALASSWESIVVVGLVLYDLAGVSSSGAVTEDTAIYSGTGREYFEPEFSGTDAPPRLFGVRIFLPDGRRGVDEDAGVILNEASMLVSESDPVFLYDDSSCSPGNFSRPTGSRESGAFVLAPAETCGFGTALNENGTDAFVGVRIRPFKAGVKTLRFEWVDFDIRDTKLTPYAQVFTVRVEGSGTPPPVVVEVGLRAIDRDVSRELSAVPCSRVEEGFVVRMYNIDSAENVILRIAGSSSSDQGAIGQDWVEDRNDFVYDPLTDSSSAFFENRGGIGRNLSYSIVASFGSTAGDEQVAAFPVSADAPDVIDFADPLSISRVVPTVIPFEGGDVALEGAFFGFDIESGDRVLIDGEVVDEKALGVSNSSIIEVAVAGVDTGGDILDVSFEVEVCGVLSNSVSLIYGAVPAASIWSLDLTQSDGIYVLPSTTEKIVFVADSSSGNFGLSYQWVLSGTGGASVQLGESVLNLPTFSLDPSLVESGGDFTLSVLLENAAGNSTAAVTIRHSPGGAASIAVALYPVPVQSRGVGNEPTFVHGSVQVFGKDLAESNSRIILEWTYDGKKYLVEELTNTANATVFDPERTGPTLFGRQLSIASKDLVLGNSSVTLNAFVDTDPSLRDEAVMTFSVQDSSLSLVINNGVNGTTIPSSNSLNLVSIDFRNASVDAIVNGTTVYEWFDCRTSSDVFFNNLGPSCLAVFPQLRWGLKTVEISSGEVSSVLPTGADEIFVLFGLRVTIGLNSRTAYVVYRVARATKNVNPQLSLASMKLHDANDNRIDAADVCVSKEISLSVESENPGDTLKFAVRTESGNELPGAWFSRGDADRGLLTIPAGILTPGSKYVISIEVEDENSDDKSLIQLVVRTRPTPKLGCTKPAVKFGVAQETSFVVSAETNAFLADMRYCFYLLNRQTSARFAIGIGCSSARVARFAWPVTGTYDLECELQSSNGETLSRVELEEISEVLARDGTQPNSKVSSGRSESGSDSLSALATLGDIAKEQRRSLEECERAGDHVCIRQMASVLPQLIAETSLLPSLLVRAEQSGGLNSSTEVGSDIPAEMPALVTKLCSLLQLMGTQTVFTAEGIASTIDAAESMVQLPPSVYDVDALFNCVYPTSLAVEAAGAASALPLRSDRVLESMQRVANISITTAGVVSSSGSVRTRLSENANMKPGDALYALFLSELPMFAARMILQRENCGFKMDIDTSIPGGPELQPPVQLHLRVLCGASHKGTRDGIEPESNFQIENVVAGSNVKVSVCPEALSGDLKFPLVVKQTNPAQFCSSGVLSGLFAIFTSPTSILFPVSPSVPVDCIGLQLPRLSDYAACAGFLPASNDAVESPEASVAESDFPLSVPEVRVGPASAPFVPNIVGGVIDGLGSINSGAGILRKELNVRIDDNVEVDAVVAAKYVSFRVQAPGEFVAGFSRDPGEGPGGVDNTKVVLIVCLISGCCVLVLAGIAVARSQWVAGVPPRVEPPGTYLERDMYGRNQVSNEEMRDAPGYVAALEADSRSAVPVDSSVIAGRGFLGDEPCQIYQVPSGTPIQLELEYMREEEEDVAEDAIPSAPAYEELRDAGII